MNAGDEMVIPPGTFVQGTVDRLEQRKGQSAELRLQSMAITFPDGYVAPVSGPITLQSNEGYAIKDPGSRRAIAAFALPAAGAGVGALIGHSVGTTCNPARPALFHPAVLDRHRSAARQPHRSSEPRPKTPSSAQELALGLGRSARLRCSSVRTISSWMLDHRWK